MAHFQKKSAATHYFELYEKYKSKYPNQKIALLYEFGSFYEFFGVNNEEEKIGNVTELTRDLHITETRCSKKILKNSRLNPQQAGFPSYALDNYVEKLIKLDYIVIIYGQFDDTSGKKKIRKLERIVSKGTYIDKIGNDDINNIICICVHPFKKKELEWLDISISMIDLSTGKSNCYSITEEKNDAFYASSKIINTSNPSELILSGISSDELDSYIHFLDLESKKSDIHIRKISSTIKRLSYQQEFLSKVFPQTCVVKGTEEGNPIRGLNPIEYLDMELNPNLVISFIILLNFVYEHDETILEKISKPIINKHNENVKLSHKTISQLNITNSEEGNSLFQIVNKTSTSMGKRLLHHKLISPINNVKILKSLYDDVGQLLTNHHYVPLEKYLKEISDLERLHRRVCINKLQPSEFMKLDDSYVSLWNILKYLKTHDIGLSKKLSEKTIKNFRLMVVFYRKSLVLTEASKYNINNIETPIFKKGLYEDIDISYEKIKKGLASLNSKKKEFNNIFNDNSVVKISKTTIDGYHLQAPPKKTSIIQSKIKGLTVKSNKSACKIFSKEIRGASSIIIEGKEELMKLCKIHFFDLLKNLSNKFSKTMKLITNFIAYLDVIKSNAKVADLYNYCKPNIVKPSGSSKASFIEAKNMRHSIVERININDPFIPFDVKIGLSNPSGLIIYGLNGSGKSIFLKTVGLLTIMAQSGMYVPADSFTYYPFNYIITKISMMDNLYKGRSTFECEMLDLGKMLEKASNNTLILADELCSGTESNDAVAIVGSAIKNLTEGGANFIFTTHLHRLTTVELIEPLMGNKIKCLHLSMTVKNGKIIYNRKFKEGQGIKSYGIEVAKQMGVGMSKKTGVNKFIKDALIIRRNIDPQTEKEILTEKQSRYNKDVYMDKCTRCGSRENLNTHHIKHQKYADKKGMIGYTPKNHKSNLEILCEGCHQREHHSKN